MLKNGLFIGIDFIVHEYLLMSPYLNSHALQVTSCRQTSSGKTLLRHNLVPKVNSMKFLRIIHAVKLCQPQNMCVHLESY